MVSRVPEDANFGRQNREKEELTRGVNDALRLGGDQYADLARRIEDIEAAQAEILATQTFLQTQSVFGSLGTVTNFTGPGGGGAQWTAFNGTYDVSLSVTTSASGRVLVTPAAMLTGGGGASLLGVEVVGVTAPSWPSAYVLASSDGTSTGSRTFEFALAGNTTYTIRNRRGFENSGIGLWGYQSLTVTRIR